MKKRILSILLLCCMVLTLLPTAAFAAGELPDVKLSVPTTFDKIVDLTGQNKELKIKDSKTYLIKGSTDPNWYFQYRIKIDGKNNTPHIFLDGVRLQAPKDGPAIELYGGASACLYFIGGDSELIGAENFAAQRTSLRCRKTKPMAISGFWCRRGQSSRVKAAGMALASEAQRSESRTSRRDTA